MKNPHIPFSGVFIRLAGAALSAMLLPVLILAQQPVPPHGDDLKTPDDEKPHPRLQIQSEPFFYKYFIERFVHFKTPVLYCGVVQEEGQTHFYEDLGACLYEQIPYFLKSTKKKTLILYFLTSEDQLLPLQITWQTLSLWDLFVSYWSKDPLRLLNQIYLTEASKGEGSAVVAHFLKSSYPQMAPFFSDTGVGEVQLHLTSYGPGSPGSSGGGLVKGSLKLLSPEKNPVYKIEFVTNYHVGSKDFFITSFDQYKKKHSSNFGKNP